MQVTRHVEGLDGPFRSDVKDPVLCGHANEQVFELGARLVPNCPLYSGARRQPGLCLAQAKPRGPSTVVDGATYANVSIQPTYASGHVDECPIQRQASTRPKGAKGVDFHVVV